MSGFNTAIKIIAALVGVVGMGVLAGRLFLGAQPKPAALRESSSVDQTLDTPGPATKTPKAANSAGPVRKSTTPAVVPAHPITDAAPRGSATNAVADWEGKIDDIFEKYEEDNQKVKHMLALFPQLPAEGQEEVAQHLVNLVADEEYTSINQFLTNNALTEDVLDVFFSDLLNRPNSTKLPTLVNVARDPKNPKSGEAREMLELFLDEDYGGDWDQWNTKVQEWLVANPD
jgi:hypothetical protein